MGRDATTLERIYERTEGRCHLCRKKLSRRNYGLLGRRGAWEVEHSTARANGGTDHGNNLYAACIACNRQKGTLSTRAARARNGYTRAPYPKKQRTRNAITGATIGSVALGVLFPQYRLLSWVVGAAVGALAGSKAEPD